MFYYLITLDTLLACALSVGLTLFWYFAYAVSSILCFALSSNVFERFTEAECTICFLYGLLTQEDNPDWSGGGMDWVILGFGEFSIWKSFFLSLLFAGIEKLIFGCH